MEKLKYILIGAGNRGGTYSASGFEYGKFEMVAVADPDDFLRNYIGDKYNVPVDKRFRSYEEVLSLEKFADFAMITTQDQLHFAPAMMAIDRGYNLLLEKPIAPTPEECLAIANAAEAKGVRVLVCHVLRYTPFCRKVKEVIASGKLGKIRSVVHSEGVGNIHYSHSYVRGNWRNSETSSDMLLAKSCHDLDLLQWLLGSQCKKVQSFGSQSYFIHENCPEGAPKRCIEGCPHSGECPYDARKIYRDFSYEEGGWLRCAATAREFPTDEDIDWVLRESKYGRCVFQCDNNVVDHQTVNLEYENGETVVFTMAAFNKGGRRIHIMGTKGELISTDFNTFSLFLYCDEDKNSPRYGHNLELNVRTKDGEIEQTTSGGHGGGDAGIMHDLWMLLGEGKTTSSISDVRTSANNHLTVFAAEQSRKNGGILVDVDQFIQNLNA